MNSETQMSMAVAITVYNTITYLRDALLVPLTASSFREVVIVDDCSDGVSIEDIAIAVEQVAHLAGMKVLSSSGSRECVGTDGNFEACEMQVGDDSSGEVTRILAVRNESNRGSFLNKIFAVRLVQSDWCFLLDSDNCLVTEAVQRLSREGPFDDNILYCPEGLIHTRGSGEDRTVVSLLPYVHYPVVRSICGDYPTTQDIISWTHDRSSVLRSRTTFFLGTGNFLFSVKSFLEVIDNYGLVTKLSTKGACSTALMALWLEAGKAVAIIPGFQYLHGLRDDSYWNSVKDVSDHEIFVERIARLSVGQTQGARGLHLICHLLTRITVRLDHWLRAAKSNLLS